MYTACFDSMMMYTASFDSVMMYTASFDSVMMYTASFDSVMMYTASVDSVMMYSCHGPRYEGQLTRMAEIIPPSGQSSSYTLTTLSSSSSTDRRAETDRIVITTRIAVAHHFRCRLRRRESCILGATSSQPTLPLHELPPARLVIHRQTSAHERRKGTLSVQSRSGILADFCPRQH